MKGIRKPHYFFSKGYWWCLADGRVYGGWTAMPVGEYMPPRLKP